MPTTSHPCMHASASLTFRSPVSGPAAAEPNLALACTEARRRVCSLQGQDQACWSARCVCVPAAYNRCNQAACGSSAFAFVCLGSVCCCHRNTEQSPTWTGHRSAATWGAAGRWRRRRMPGSARSLEGRSMRVHNQWQVSRVQQSAELNVSLRWDTLQQQRPSNCSAVLHCGCKPHTHAKVPPEGASSNQALSSLRASAS